MKNKKRMKADALLLLIAFIWGASFSLNDICLLEMNPLEIVAFRFLISGIVVLLIFYKRLKNINKETVRSSIMLGVFLFVVYSCLIYGIDYTTETNAAFLSATSSIFVPFTAWIINKKKPGKVVLTAVITGFVGMALLVLNEDFSVNLIYLKGDIMSLISGIAYAVHITITEKTVEGKKIDIILLGSFQLIIVGMIGVILSLAGGGMHIPHSIGAWGALLFLTFICTGIAFVLQPIAQVNTTSSHTGLIFSVEPVFAMIIAVLFLGEVYGLRNYIGAALIFCALIIAERE